MRIKRVTLLAFTLLMVLMIGCSKKAKEAKDESSTKSTPTILNPSPTEPTTIVPVDAPPFKEFSVEALTELAKLLTDEVLEGDFEGVNSYFTPDIKEIYTPEVLKEAYQTTIQPLGSFSSIDSFLSQETDEAIYIGVILEFENNGMLITYGFNKKYELTTFHFSYYDLEPEGVVSDVFTEHEIEIGLAEEPLDGLLTLPNGIDQPPVVILVHGSGQSDMDETIGAVNNKPFRDIAHGLATKGIASIRYNKRYYQYADSIPENMTVYEEVLEDVYDAISFAQSSEKVDPNRIYILGHSFGGMLSPKIASEKEIVAGIISLAGSPRKLEDIIYDQAVFFTSKDESTEESEKELYLEIMSASVERVKSLSQVDLLEPILGCTGYYWQSLNEINTIEIVTKLKIPMLFLQGSADFQVFSEVDFALWKKILQDQENATFIEYPGLNHLFMPTTGAFDTSDYDIKSKVDDQVITDIAKWIQSQ